MSELSLLTEQACKGKRVLVRVDWNVPLGVRGEVQDPFRIEASLATIRELKKRGAAQITLLTHLGNPVVRPRESIERTLVGNRRLLLAPIARYVIDALSLAGDHELREIPDSPLPGYQLDPKIILLENLRLHPGELANDIEFAQQLARLGDLFVNEAFSESHREVASLGQLATLLPSAAGLRLADEVAYFTRFREKTDKPLVIVLGGAKVHDKIGLIDNLLKKADAFLLGGVMANTFLAAQGTDMRKSLVEVDRIEAAKELFNRAPQKFILPLDFVWERDRALDIGPQTVALFSRYIDKAKLVFWNGPMGWTASGRERFAHGTRTLAETCAKSPATTVAAGGDTLAIIDHYRLGKDFTFLSTGGGAALAFLSNNPMPGLAGLAKTH